MPKIKITSFRIALLSVVLAFGLYLLDAKLGFLEKVELKSLDMRYSLKGESKPSDTVVILDIDEKSLSELGQWPWPRSIMAKAIDILAEAGTRVIGIDVIYNEPEENRERQALRERLQERYPDGVFDESSELYQELLRLEQEETNDEKLAAAMRRADNVVLPIYFYFSEEEAEKQSVSNPLTQEEINKFTFSSFLNYQDAANFPIPAGKGLSTPLPMFRGAAKNLGHVSAIADIDGVHRWESLAIRYGEHYFPSFAFQVAKDFSNLEMHAVRVNFGDSIDLSQIGNIATDESSRMLINYLGGYKTFKYYSFTDVYHNKVASDEFQDKTVLVGASVPGLLDEKIVPIGRMPGVERHANIVENILTGKVLMRMGWMEIFDFILALVLCFLLNLFVSRFRPIIAFILTIGAFGLFFFIIHISFSYFGLWIKLVFPIVAMAFTFGLTTFVRIQTEEKVREEIKTIFADFELKDIDERVRTLQRVPKESSDYGKACTLLGQSFMEKGLYSVAEKAFNRALEGREFQEESKDTYYMLGMLHEKQNQPEKAKEIYKTISTFDSGYKDVTQRMEKLDELKTQALQGELLKTRSMDTVSVSAIEAKQDMVIADRYMIKKEIGKGGMGKVLLAQDTKLDELIALKLLVPQRTDDEEEVKRFTREIKITRKINHPNVIRVFDIGEWQGNHFITMEYIDGGNLYDWMKIHPTEIKGRIHFVRQICAGLDAAHQLNIVHRDIKPENILIDRGTVVKIVDFGIARGLGIGTRTVDGKVIGTPDFMSPEQIMGKDLDQRSDIYSLGVLMYQLFTGKLPFHGENLGVILFKHIQEYPAPPNTLNPNIPSAMIKIILKSMEKEPKSRYQTTEEILSEIKVH